MTQSLQSIPPSSSTPNQAEVFRQFIENEVLKVITHAVEGGKSKEDVQAMAKLVLDLIKPGMPLDELYKNAAKLDDSFSEFAPIVFSIMKEYEQKFEKRALEGVSQMVKNGQYDDAQALVKKVLAYKMT